MNPFHEAYAYSKQQMLFQAINFPINQSFYQPKTWTNSESCNIPATRKRSRDEFYAQKSSNRVFGENKLPQIPLEMDALILEHTKKIRLEFQERQKQLEAKVVVERMGESMAKTLREKDEDIEKMERSNAMLEEKAKRLYAENQLWREMAQTNEAAANSLQHVLAEEEQLESCGDYIYDKRRLCRMCGERLCCSAATSAYAADVAVGPTSCGTTMTATLHVNMS